MSTYVMADLHGDWAHFRLMLYKIRFSRQDTLYIVGDVVDRGTHGIHLLRYTMQQDNIILLMGNHEMMLLEGLLQCSDDLAEEWFDPPTFDELRQLSIQERREIQHYLTALPLSLFVSVAEQRYQLVHACPAPSHASRETALKYLLWHRVTADQTFSNPVVAGHTPTAYYQSVRPLRIWRNGNFTDIDCGTAFRSVLAGGCLACLRLDDGKEFYV